MTNINLTDQEASFLADYFEIELEHETLSNTTRLLMRSIIKKLEQSGE